LSGLEDQVEKHLSVVVEKYQNLSAGALTQRPPDGGWSVAECLWHLNSYGDYYLPKIEQGLTKGTTATARFTSTWLGAYFTRIMQPGPGMKKMKAFKDHRPPLDIDPHKVVAQFIQHQEVWLKIFRRARSADMNQIRIGISILPWLKLKLGDVFQFAIAHQERHMQQAERVRMTLTNKSGLE
jgi:hypothetical protein